MALGWAAMLIFIFRGDEVPKRKKAKLIIAVVMVVSNVPFPVPVGYHSFGGWNDSAFGDHTIYGPEGLRFYTRPKVVTSRWPDPSTNGVDLGFPRND